jgi:hypothetical protein
MRNENENNSDLYRIMSIVQNDKELTAYLYLLNWIQEIELYKYKNNLDENMNKIINEKSPINLAENSNYLEFDEINNNNNKIYNEFLIQLSNLIIRGNLIEAQKRASKRELLYINSCFNGGLPLCDFSLEKNFENFDKDLIPPYFKNLEFNDNLSYIYEEKKDDKIIGNNNWIMWLTTLYDTCNNNNINEYFRLICRLLSGNNNNYFINENNVDEYLYINFLNLFNAKLFSILYHNEEKINYHFCPDTYNESEKFFKNNRINNIFEFINNIRNESKYNSVLQENFTLEIELRLIELFFYKITNINLFYENLQNFYKELNDKIDSNKIPYLNDKKINIEINNNIILNQNNLMKISYLKLIFNLIISFYSTNKNDFEKNEYNEYLFNIHIYHDLLVEKYINNLYYLTFDPKIIVFLTGFCFNLNSIIRILTNYSKKGFLKDNNHLYLIFIEEISEVFIEYKETIFIEIAKSTNILHFIENKNSIDMVLNKYIEEYQQNINVPISNEDNLKIEQVKFLFVNKFNEINIDTIHEYIIKLGLKFISNYKFNELNKLIEETFKNNKIININLDELDDIIQKIQQNDINNIINEITYSFIKLINDCFFEYYKIRTLELNINEDINIKKNLSDFSMNYLNNYLLKLNQLIKFIINNNNYLNNLQNFLNNENENMFEIDYLKIISDWSYQTVKWIVDLFYDKIIENKNDFGLQLTNEGILFNNNMFENYFILCNNFGNFYEDYLNKEKKFFDFLGKHKSELLKLLYKMTTISKSYLSEIMDENLKINLDEDIKKGVEYIDYYIDI